jgi:hypothetical protein
MGGARPGGSGQRAATTTIFSANGGSDETTEQRTVTIPSFEVVFNWPLANTVKAH